MDSTDTQTGLPKRLMLTLSAFQGVALTLLYLSVEHQWWLGQNPTWFTALATFAFSFPLLMLLCTTRENAVQAACYILPFTLLLSLLGAYVGFQNEPIEYVSNESAMFIFGFTALLACFKGLMYIQLRLSGTPLTYASLFRISWRNFLIFVESSLFKFIFLGILHLGAGLFSIVGIDLFSTLLDKAWFTIPVLCLAFGFAVVIFRNIIHTVDNIATILQTLIKFLLPALSIVSLGFLITLPFTGLTALWETGNGTFLVMSLQLLSLFFINAVYQQGEKNQPYHLLLHRLILTATALLPVYSLISGYGLLLRIMQYGWTLDRCWAVLIWVLLACFSFSYLVGIVRLRDQWLSALSKINITMGLVFLAMMLLVNSPILNFQYIAAQSQLARLDKSATTFDKFDYYYFENNLGRQGYLAIQTLKTQVAETNPEILAIIERMYIPAPEGDKDITEEAFIARINYWPDDASAPPSLLTALYEREVGNDWQDHRTFSYYLLRIDMNEDGEVESIFIRENNHTTQATLWLLNNEEWIAHYMPYVNGKAALLQPALENGDVKVVEPTWYDVQIGDMRLRAPSQ